MSSARPIVLVVFLALLASACGSSGDAVTDVDDIETCDDLFSWFEPRLGQMTEELDAVSTNELADGAGQQSLDTFTEDIESLADRAPVLDYDPEDAQRELARIIERQDGEQLHTRLFLASLADAIEGEFDSEPTATPRRGSVSVRYVVEVTNSGSTDVDIRYTNRTGGRETATLEREGTWEERYLWNEDDFASVSAHLPYNAPGRATIECELIVDGDRVDHERATGPSASVSCSELIRP